MATKNARASESHSTDVVDEDHLGRLPVHSCRRPSNAHGQRVEFLPRTTPVSAVGTGPIGPPARIRIRA